MTGSGDEHNQTLSFQDCCAVLGVPETASRLEAARAFRRRVRECHPDAHPERADGARELMMVIRAHRLLDDYRRQRDHSRIEKAFRESGKAASRRQADPTLPEAYLHRGLKGIGAGLAAGLLHALLSGGLTALADTPAVLWCIWGMAGPGALAGGIRAIGSSEAGAATRFAAGGIAGAALGIMTGTVCVRFMDAYCLDPARAWALPAFASWGGLAAIAIAIMGTRR